MIKLNIPVRSLIFRISYRYNLFYHTRMNNYDLNLPFLLAASRGDLDEVKEWIKFVTNINAANQASKIFIVLN